MRKSNYDKQPSTHIEGKAIIGWDNIVETLSQAWADEPVWAIDLYPGTYEEDFIKAFSKTGRKIIDTRSLMRPEEEIRQLTERFMTDDVLFGYMSNVRLEEYWSPLPAPPLGECSGGIVIIGTGAAFVAQKHSPKGGAGRGLACIVSNPPYICESEAAAMDANVLDHEPHLALFVPDDDPLLFYKAISEFGQEYLADSGLLFFEVNRAYAEQVAELLLQKGYRETKIVKDQYDNNRFVWARKIQD